MLSAPFSIAGIESEDTRGDGDGNDSLDLDQHIIQMSPQQPTTLRLVFSPTLAGRCYSNLYLADGALTMNLVVFGDGGDMSITSSLGPPMELATEGTPALLDMGAVRVGMASNKAFQIVNNGSIDVLVAGIESSEDEGLDWAFLDGEAAQKDLPVFGQESLDSNMIDWDEVCVCVCVCRIILILASAVSSPSLSPSPSPSPSHLLAMCRWTTKCKVRRSGVHQRPHQVAKLWLFPLHMTSNPQCSHVSFGHHKPSVFS